MVEQYLWQDSTTLLATYDGNGNLKQRFEYTLGHTPSSFTQNGQRYFIQTDHLGSPRVITDSSGNIVKTISYDSYGNIIEDSNPEFQILFGFAGGDINLYRYVLGDPINWVDIDGLAPAWAGPITAVIAAVERDAFTKTCPDCI